MSLLVDIAAQALDPRYAAAAVRRSPAPPRRTSAWLLVGGVLAATLLIVMAGVQAHRAAPAAARSREALVAQVDHRQKEVVGLQDRLDRLRAATASLRDQTLATTAAGTRLARLLADEELAAGTVAATGPGMRVVLNDAPSVGGQPGNHVLDRDLQAVVNGLWAAGAEAVGVNDQRVTTQTAIREAGGAILVNFSPLSPPYVVSAVGDPVGMETAFGSSHTAARIRDLSQLYGLRFQYSRSSSLELPPAPGLTLRYAAVAPRGANR